MKNAISWFEIPAKNFNRAKKFYETVLGTTLEVYEDMPQGPKMAVFPYDRNNEGVGGAIVEGKDYEPASQGVLIYLSGGEDLNIPLAKVAQAGGKVLLPKTSIDPNGFMARFEDTEGNQLALHSFK